MFGQTFSDDKLLKVATLAHRLYSWKFGATDRNALEGVTEATGSSLVEFDASDNFSSLKCRTTPIEYVLGRG